MNLAISVRQPWAWSIIYGGKDIENRDWPTRIRGRVLIHAAKGMTDDEYHDTVVFAHGLGVSVPMATMLHRGGIIGSVEIVDCVERSPSPWFFGRFGFVLRNPIPCEFRPMRGALGFFKVPETP